MGRGLGALLGEEALSPQESAVTLLPLQQVEPDPNQPRKDFDPEALQTLADSIAEHGVIQPLAVRKLESGYYRIIAGERRWRAARLAGLREIPVCVLQADDRAVAELSLVENLQREDLNPLEEAQGYARLIEEFSLTQEQVADRVGKSRPAVANALRLLTLSGPVQAMVADGSLSAGHARALIPLKDPDLQRRAAEETVGKGLSVRQTEKLAAALLKGDKKPPEEDPDTVNYVREAERRLSDALGRGVRLTGGNKGRITLEFYTADDREALMSALIKMDKPWKEPKQE